ncbi:MAG: DMT family transporter [Pseudomonadota bacterium]
MYLNKTILLGSFFIILGEIFFVLMGMLVKYLGDEIPNHQLVFYRNLLAAIIIIPILYKQGLHNIKTERIGMHLIRAVSGILAMYCFYYALIHIELADAMMLKMTAPIFIPIIAILWIKEHVTLKTTLAILIGFLGVLIYLNPTAEIQFAALIGLVGGALAAIAKVSIRRMSNTEPTARIVFYFALFGAIISSVPVFMGELYIPDSYQVWGLLLLVGLTGTCAQFCLTKAYSIAPASQIGPFTYSSLLWASLGGWLFWSEIPSTSTLIGASLIITSGVLLLYRKRYNTTDK